MEDGKEECGWPAVRQGDDCRALNAQVIEQVRVGVRLFVERGARAKRRPQVSEAGRRDPVESIPEHGPSGERSLVEAAAAPVNHEDRGTYASSGELDVAERRRHDRALAANPVMGAVHVTDVECRGSGGDNRQREQARPGTA